MSNLSSVLVIPDSLIAKEATDLLREHSTDPSAFTCSQLSRAVNESFASILNFFTSRPHFTISVSLRNSRAQTNASKSMAQTRPVSFSRHIKSLKNR